MINILGLAGSGKSTQGKLLAERLNCPWVSMGNLLREKGDKKIQEDILKGVIVEDSKTLAILDEDLRANQADKKEYVIDGWPRALNQAKWLADKCEAGEVMMTAVIHLKAHQGVAKERLMHRGRVDDNESAIIQRFKDYQETILPILDYLKSRGIRIIEVNADDSIEEVERSIDRELGIL